MSSRLPACQRLLVVALLVAAVLGEFRPGDVSWAYETLGAENGSTADEVIDSFVDLVFLQRDLENDLKDKDLSSTYSELKEALIAILSGPGAQQSCPSGLDGNDPPPEKRKRTRRGEDPPVNPRVTVQLPMVIGKNVLDTAIRELSLGNLDNAKFLLDAFVSEHPDDLGGRIARGTARALSGDLKGGKSDFDHIISLNPNFSEAYKRRSQTLAALGENNAALEDLEAAARLTPPSQRGELAELSQHKGMIMHKLEDFISCEKEFKAVVEANPSNTIGWNMLGLCLASQGKIEESLGKYERCISLKPSFREVYANYVDAMKETGNLTRLEKAATLPALQSKKDALAVRAFIHLAESHQIAGNHAYCVKLMDEYSPRTCGELTIWCFFLRGHCFQALGRYREAVADYSMALQTPAQGVPNDVQTMQILSFYMKELAIYAAHHVDDPVWTYNVDSDLDPSLKEAWTRKQAPSEKFIISYVRQPPLGPLDLPPSDPSQEQVGHLLEAAAVLGPLIHYRHNGFAANRRTQRMAGLAILEAAQAVQGAIEGFISGKPAMAPNSGSSAVPEPGTTEHVFGWRDFFDVIVKWRQLTEPNDAVMWCDRMTLEGFTEGFGAHTPMVIGQFLSRRYSSNLPRGIHLLKTEIAAAGGFYSVENNWIPLDESAVGQLQKAEDLSDIYAVMGVSGWTTIMVNSTIGKEALEATRVTLLRRPGKADSFDFSIRTPVTPARFEKFAAELETQWDNLMRAAEKGDKSTAARTILVIGYLWYNLMALARGTAAVGYISILSLFLALDMPVLISAPKGFQLDWAAIFSKDADEFVEATGSWMLPPGARGAESSTPIQAEEGCVQDGGRFCGPGDVRAADVPVVRDVLPTARARVHLLNKAVEGSPSQV